MHSKASLKDIFSFPLQLWLICLITTFYFGCLFVFVNLNKKFLVEKYEVSIFKASSQVSLFFFSLVIFSPIFGVMISLIGYTLFWVVIAACLTIFCHLSLALSFVSPYIILFILGLSGAIFNASLFTILPGIIKSHQLGSAFGLLQSILNLGLSIFNILAGIIVSSHGYFVLELFFYYLSACK